MSTLSLDQDVATLRNDVHMKFAKARADQALVFPDTELATVQTKLPIPIQIRYCPALAKKPVKQEEAATDKKKFDPFENPSEDLLVGKLPVRSPTHNIVLNKYPVIQNHFILSTIENKPQTGLLDAGDLFITLACLRAWNQSDTSISGPDDHSLFAFFNSGTHSGASQPHRHIQFLPVEDMKDGQVPDSSGWNLLCNSMTTPAHSSLSLLECKDLECVHYAIALESHVDKAVLHQKYVLLLEAALAAINHDASRNGLEDACIVKDAQVTFSYNLAMTKDMMATLPRRNELARISGLQQDVFVNGTYLAGTIMVKDETDWHQLQRDPSRLQQIVSRIAYNRSEHQKL